MNKTFQGFSNNWWFLKTQTLRTKTGYRALLNQTFQLSWSLALLSKIEFSFESLARIDLDKPSYWLESTKEMKWNTSEEPYKLKKDQLSFQNHWSRETMWFAVCNNGCWKMQVNTEFFYHQIHTLHLKGLETLFPTFSKTCSSIIHFTTRRPLKPIKFTHIAC